MTTFTLIKKINKNNADYVQMAIEKLIETCDWVNADDNNILILKNGHDFVAIPDAYENEGTEFWTTLDVLVVLTSDKHANYIAVTVE